MPSAGCTNSCGVWLYATLPLRYRDRGTLMLDEIEVTAETMREWCQQLGQPSAKQWLPQRPD